MTQTDTDADANARGTEYFIACTHTACDACGQPTRVVALTAPAGHERMESEENPFDVVPPRVWQSCVLPAFLFYITYLPDAVRNRLQAVAPAYAFMRNASSGESYWANHCTQCGSALDDVALYCEPDGAFMPMSAAAATHITLALVAESFAVAAAGCSDEPALFRAMPTA